jgi:hypothetical protein
MIVPDGMVSRTRTEHQLLTTETKPGHRVFFHLEVPGAEPARPLHDLNFQFRPWADIDEPWRFYPDSGIIEINTEAPDFKRALDGRDQRMQQLLLALYSSLALSRHVFEGIGGVEAVLQQHARLFAAALGHLPTGKTRGKK